MRRRWSGRCAAADGARADRPGLIVAGRSGDDLRDLVARAEAGEARAVGRLISLVEDGSPLLPEVMALLARPPGSVRVVGLTGAPGVGKSTSTSALVAAYRRRGLRVGVLAVDPSSPFSGGALLGDRIRMQEHATDEGVFIRSMASRGQLGGLSLATPQAVRVLSAAGCDIVLIETVGVGQAEVEVAALADTTVVLLAPGMGDGIQAAKAGILEIADLLVVNKADRDGAQALARDLRHMLALTVPGGWTVPVIQTVASRGDGVDAVREAVEQHGAWLASNGRLAASRIRRAAHEIEAIALVALRARLVDPRRGEALSALAGRVAEGDLDPYAAADQLVESLT